MLWLLRPGLGWRNAHQHLHAMPCGYTEQLHGTTSHCTCKHAWRMKWRKVGLPQSIAGCSGATDSHHLTHNECQPNFPLLLWHACLFYFPTFLATGRVHYPRPRDGILCTFAVHRAVQEPPLSLSAPDGAVPSDLLISILSVDRIK